VRPPRTVDERYDEGYRDGGEAALRSMTHLATMLNDRRTLEALHALLRFIDAQAEDERQSAYWHDEVDESESLPG